MEAEATAATAAASMVSTDRTLTPPETLETIRHYLMRQNALGGESDIIWAIEEN